MSVKERCAGALWGGIVGDALGVPVEFIDRAALDAAPVTNMRGHGTYDQPAGTWSDDTSMTLATVSALTETGFNTQAIMAEFCHWLNDAHWTPYATVFDVGFTTQKAIKEYVSGAPIPTNAPDGEGSNGNGSLMRSLPLAIWARHLPDTTIIEQAFKLSELTHRSMTSPQHLTSGMPSAVSVCIRYPLALPL